MRCQRRVLAGNGREVTRGTSNKERVKQALGIRLRFVHNLGGLKPLHSYRTVVQSEASEVRNTHSSLIIELQKAMKLKAELHVLKNIMMPDNQKIDIKKHLSKCPRRMLEVVLQILADGLSRPDLVNTNDIDVDMAHVPNSVLRQIQAYLISPNRAVKPHQLTESIADLNRQIFDKEVEYLDVLRGELPKHKGKDSRRRS